MSKIEDSAVYRPYGANSWDAYVTLWQVFKIDKVQDHKWAQMVALLWSIAATQKSI